MDRGFTAVRTRLRTHQPPAADAARRAWGQGVAMRTLAPPRPPPRAALAAVATFSVLFSHRWRAASGAQPCASFPSGVLS